MSDTVDVVAKAIRAPNLGADAREGVWRTASYETRARYRRMAQAAIDSLQLTHAIVELPEPVEFDSAFDCVGRWRVGEFGAVVAYADGYIIDQTGNELGSADVCRQFAAALLAAANAAEQPGPMTDNAGLYKVPAQLGRGMVWATRCEHCGKEVRMGAGSKAAMLRLIETVGRLCNECRPAKGSGDD